MEAQRSQRVHPGHAGEFIPRAPPRWFSGLCSPEPGALVLTLQGFDIVEAGRMR